jgi:hypothetical protein
MIKIIATTALIFGLFNIWTNFSSAPLANDNALPTDAPIVIELFTSQSCSSCPPADKNLAELSQNPNIIPLAFHVTYWDHLHWKDTLSREFATQRQRTHARYNSSNRVYTPQMVINGSEQFVGSRKDRIRSALKNAKPLKAITLIQNGDTLTAHLPATYESKYTLWLAGVQNTHTQKIPSGENRGKTVDYHNAVLTLENIGDWNGAHEKRTLNSASETGIDHYVLFAQKGGYGEILAAGKSKQP